MKELNKTLQIASNQDCKLLQKSWALHINVNECNSTTLHKHKVLCTSAINLYIWIFGMFPLRYFKKFHLEFFF